MKAKLLILAFFLIPTYSMTAQSSDFERLDQFMDTLEVHQRTSGSLALRADGKLVFSRSIGLRNIIEGDLILPDEETVFRVGSISKTFTSVLVLQQVEKGSLNLDDKLSKWYPSVPNASKITLRQMLNHSSGIFSITADPTYLEYMETEQTHSQMLQRIYGFEAAFEPGSKHAYSNSNYVLLGYILEKVTGMSYGELVNKNIVKPLKLKRTYYGGAIDPQGQNEAFSYEWNGNGYTPSTETDMSIPHGAGSMVSTAEDLTVFITGLFKGKLIGEMMLAEMVSVEDGYGLGIFPVELNGKEGFGHNGGIDDFVATVAYFNEDELAVAYTSNVARYDIDEISETAVRAFYGSDFEIPVFKVVKLDAEYLESLVGTYKSESFPLPIEVRTNGFQLTAQAEGQPELPLQAEGDNVFTLERAGIIMTFTADESGAFCCFHLDQGQFQADFKKE